MQSSAPGWRLFLEIDNYVDFIATFSGDSGMIAPILIFLGTYLVIAVGSLPGLRVDRTGAAIIGASLMIGFNVLTFEEAYNAINYDTIILLFGMMIVVANLRLSGFFTAVSEWAVEHTHHPLGLLAAVILVSGVFSAFFVNDTMCLVLTPMVLDIVLALGRNPIPYLLAIAMASNIGSVATITGNPQNMMIGAFSKIHYRDFAAALSPVAAAGLVVTFAAIALIYRNEFSHDGRVELERKRIRVNRVLMWKSLIASVAMMVFFFAGWPVPKVALLAGALLLITRRVKPEKVYHEIDFSLLVLFIGLFIVVAGFEKTPLASEAMSYASGYGLGRPAVLGAFSAILSNFVSNVPAVLVLKPFIGRLADAKQGWLILAMSSTLAGNLTILGSVANLIVAQRARRQANISFWEHFKVGAPVAIATIAIGLLLLT
jgi:Na+/H+ antiporter NhaD/arsenite permease-like protein